MQPGVPFSQMLFALQVRGCTMVQLILWSFPNLRSFAVTDYTRVFLYFWVSFCFAKFWGSGFPSWNEQPLAWFC